MKKTLLIYVFFVFVNITAMDARENQVYCQISAIILRITGIEGTSGSTLNRAKSGDEKAQTAIRAIIQECDLFNHEITYSIAREFFENNAFYWQIVKQFWENPHIKSGLVTYCTVGNYFLCLKDLLFDKNLTVEILRSKAAKNDISVLEDMLKDIFCAALNGDILALNAAYVLYNYCSRPDFNTVDISIGQAIEQEPGLLDKISQHYRISR
ncbi:MAG: hypothetical protein LBQ08_03995 [Holosporaceae bacterium]|nr:hypothetical protein [Holosporaceae bacterium]